MLETPKAYAYQSVKMAKMKQWTISRDSLKRKPSTTTNGHPTNEDGGIVYLVIKYMKGLKFIKNEINLKEDYAELTCHYKGQPVVFKIDLDKVEFAKSHKWCAHRRAKSDPPKFDMGTTINHHFVKYHQLMVETQAHETVDHVNRDTTDNRVCNLRAVDRRIQGFNQSRERTLARGVFHHRNGYYYAAIRFNKKLFYGPCTQDINEAKYCYYLMTQLCYPGIEVPDLNIDGIENISDFKKEEISRYVKQKYERKFL